MKNHNFLNWELTQLLPEKSQNYYSKYQSYESWILQYFNTGEDCMVEDYYICAIEDDPDVKMYIENLQDVVDNIKNVKYKQTWTYEDVRLYLKEKGYKFVEVPARDGLYQIWYKDEMIWDFYKDTYEEAREAGIKYCLELINKENENSRV